MLAYITWEADPIILTLGRVRLSWYGLLFAVGLLVFGYYILDKMWKREQLPEKWFTYLVIYTVLGTFIGARLGHVLFYNPSYYLANPIEILKTWEGGLASHGGVLGIIIAIYFYSKKVSHKSMLWVFDRLAVPSGLVAAMIRTGNLMNHEIYGRPTDLPWGFRFITNLYGGEIHGGEPVFSLPSHPTQIYEALAYLIIFAICMYLYWKRDAYKKTGLIFGVFMTLLFTARFFIEFLKNPQEDFEVDMLLNMGQLLSIPFIIVGIASIVYSQKAKQNNI
ncbi:prolipoprotein diacylglyceryl transferase [Porphyromonas sp. COT-108 OH1349]|uniref:prolipoprotein diacylglyceryl transferase n=1 Tax=Porphyromonas sp. COT-108 OH1349 TaxID=1537504 RepID=UPI00052DE453|nr:prolipoprotein diacylglyceryl transferase [Porphyromonas sp. COT-108 OH1349]KGN71886.1 prolipoprotein diacylglyceryl transferase [Porphyromonas sp. COT-108 OH1349]